MLYLDLLLYLDLVKVYYTLRYTHYKTKYIYTKYAKFSGRAVQVVQLHYVQIKTTGKRCSRCYSHLTRIKSVCKNKS